MKLRQMFVSTTGAAASLLLLAATAPGQTVPDAPRRAGLWYGLGAGAGWDRLACDICAGDRNGGLSGYLQAGGTIEPGWLLGGELKFWNKGDEAVDQLLGAFSVVALWYPRPERRLHFKGGFGYLTLRAEDAENTLATSAFGPQIGIGYDLAIGPRVSLTPYASWMFAPFGDLRFNDTKIRGGVRSTLLQLGLGVTHH